MAISVSCACGKKYTLKDELAGKRGKCNACGQTFVIPQPEAIVEDIVELSPAPQQLAPPTNQGYATYPQHPQASPQPHEGIVSADYATPQAASSYPGYQPPGGFSLPGYPQASYGAAGTPQSFGGYPQPAPYDPLAGQMGIPSGGQPGFYGPPPAKATPMNLKPLIFGGIGVTVAIVVGTITFVATQSLFKRPKALPVAVASPPAPVVGTPPTPQPVTTTAKAPPIAPMVPAAPAQPAAPVPTGWTATIDPAAVNGKALSQPIGIELNPVDVERVTLTSPAINKVVLASRKENKGKLLIYDLAAGKKLTDWESPKYGPAIQITSLSPSGEYFAFSAATQETEVWSIKENKQLANFKAVQGGDGLTSFVAMLDNGKLLTGSTSGTLALWKLPDPQKIWNKEKLGYFGFNILGSQAAISPNHKYLAIYRESKVELLEIESGNLRGQLAPIPGLPPVTTLSALAFHPDGKRLAAIIFTPTNNNSLVAIWDLQSGGLTQHFPIVVAQHLNIAQSLLRRPNEPPPTWSASSAAGKAVWWGDQHLLLGSRFVIDLQAREVVARLNLSWVGVADSPLGAQICYTSGAKPHEPGQLAAVAVPTQLWQQQLAAQASGATWLKPGTCVGVNLQFDGPPTAAPVFRDQFMQQLKARLVNSGLVVDGTPELTYQIQTRTEETNVTYTVHSFGGRGGPPQQIKGRRLIADIALNSPQGQSVWKKELRLEPPFSFSSHGQEDFAAAQLNAHWTTLAQEALSLFPWCLPKDTSQKPLPLELNLEPGGVK